MTLNRGEQPLVRAQVEGPQVKYICIKKKLKFQLWILTCDLLCDGVLHLQPGIHLHEVMTA